MAALMWKTLRQKMYLSSKVVNAVKKIMKLIEWDNS